MGRKRVTLTRIPAGIRDALGGDQPQRPINDLCTEILSKRYGIPFTPSGKNGRNWDYDNGTLTLKLPESVWAALKQEAVPYDTIKNVAVQAIAEHYQLSV